MAKQHYVDNKKFYEAILEHKRLCAEALEKGLDEPRISNYIGECIYKIAEKLSTKPCFIGYSFRDEMISDGIENCILYFKDYNPNIGTNPFAYFTQVIFYAFIRRIGKEEKHRYTLYRNFQEVLMCNNDTSLLVDNDDKNILPRQLYDNINVFMEKYENKENDKKEKRKQVKQGLEKFYEASS
jgi:hypothetical protein